MTQDPAVPEGVSKTMLQELHLLTRDGKLNADARRKLKQVDHLVRLLKPALEDVLGRSAPPTIVDCGAGKSYLGFLLYEMVLGPAGRGQLLAVESRPELIEGARARAARFGYDRIGFVAGAIATAALPERIHLVTALHACDTATDDALALGIIKKADYIAVVPCCQAELSAQLAKRTATPFSDLYRHPWHRREFGSHLTNVLRALTLEACGYQVTVTELVGWEHSFKNELIIARRVGSYQRDAGERLAQLVQSLGIEPSLLRLLAAARITPGQPPAPVA